jgi:CheY-like chemotaxis protein
MGFSVPRASVLLADDNALNREAFLSILEREYAVTQAQDGREALDLASERRFDVILLDVRMPLLDGFETAEELRKGGPNRDTPVIFLSAHEEMMVPMMKCGYIAGATDFMFGLVDDALLRLKVATYVALRLRDDAMRTQVQHIAAMLAMLQRELYGAPPALHERIRVISASIGEMKRHLRVAEVWPSHAT